MESLRTGDRVDGFEVGDILHSGAMATIYQARDMISNQVVALKVPFADIFNHPIQYYHYQNEERIGRCLDHTNVVRFYNRYRSFHYIVQEKIEGVDLRSRIGRSKRIPLPEACGLILQIASGLIHIHSRQVIHLDLKPENIMLTPENRVKIIDFGLARKQGVEDLLADDFTSPHGTPFYMAPEQILGERGEVRSDLYSLGIIFYEMLTSRLPYKRSKKLSQIRRRLKQEPVPPRYYDADIPPQIQEIILRAIGRRLEDRYGSVSELCQDLEYYKNVVVTELGRKSRPEKWWTTLTNRPVTLKKERKLGRNGVIKEGYRILGCIFDHDFSDLVVDAARRYGLLRDGDVTLLCVVEDDLDQEFHRYAVQTEGESFCYRIEKYIQLLRRYDLDPTIRIIQGDIRKTIGTVATAIDCDLILMGKPRKKRTKTLIPEGGGLIPTGCEVVVCDEKRLEVDEEMETISFKALTEETTVAIDLFLIDLWFEHLVWLSNTANGLLLDESFVPEQDVTTCRMGVWLGRMRTRDGWRDLVERIDEPHGAIHALVADLAQAMREGNPQAMKEQYLGTYQQLSCSLLDGLRLVSMAFHQRCEVVFPPVSILGRRGCPLYGGEVPSGGPLLKLKQVDLYLDRGNGP